MLLITKKTLLATLLTLVLFSVATPLSAGSCPLITEVGLPSVVGSGAWLGDELVVVDFFQRELFRYSHAGVQKASRPLSAIQGLPQSYEPRAIRADGSQVTLQFNGGQFAQLGQGLEVMGRWNLASRRSQQREDGREILRIYSTWVKSGDYIFYCGDFQTGGGYESGFAVSSWPSVDTVEEVRLVDSAAQEMAYCRLNLPNLAAGEDGTFYALVSDSVAGEPETSTQIMKVEADEGGIEWKLLNDRVRFPPRPELPRFRNDEGFAAVMKKMERSIMPAGLFLDPRGDRLYVLLREPEGPTVTWSLQSVDAETGKKIGKPTVLPSQSPHLIVVPGVEQWALLEQGVALGFKEIRSKGLRLVSADDIRRASDSPTGGEICTP